MRITDFNHKTGKPTIGFKYAEFVVAITNSSEGKVMAWRAQDVHCNVIYITSSVERMTRLIDDSISYALYSKGPEIAEHIIQSSAVRPGDESLHPIRALLCKLGSNAETYHVSMQRCGSDNVCVQPRFIECESEATHAYELYCYRLNVRSELTSDSHFRHNQSENNSTSFNPTLESI